MSRKDNRNPLELGSKCIMYRKNSRVGLLRWAFVQTLSCWHNLVKSCERVFAAPVPASLVMVMQWFKHSQERLYVVRCTTKQNSRVLYVLHIPHRGLMISIPQLMANCIQTWWTMMNLQPRGRLWICASNSETHSTSTKHQCFGEWTICSLLQELRGLCEIAPG